MAGNLKKERLYEITIDSNPNYCGIGAGGLQFANGLAVVKEGTLCNWYKEHDGYTVSEAISGDEVESR